MAERSARQGWAAWKQPSKGRLWSLSIVYSLRAGETQARACDFFMRKNIVLQEGKGSFGVEKKYG